MLKHFTKLDESLAVGSYVSTPQQLDQLVEAGVRGVISLQSDEDLSLLGVRWEWLWQEYTARKIAIERVPVRDFDKRDLLRHLDTAVAELGKMVERKGMVYVHCTAGLNRSPSTIVGHCMVTRGWSMETAVEWVMERHRAEPYVKILRKWSKRNRLPVK